MSTFYSEKVIPDNSVIARGKRIEGFLAKHSDLDSDTFLGIVVGGYTDFNDISDARDDLIYGSASIFVEKALVEREGKCRWWVIKQHLNAAISRVGDAVARGRKLRAYPSKKEIRGFGHELFRVFDWQKIRNEKTNLLPPISE